MTFEYNSGFHWALVCPSNGLHAARAWSALRRYPKGAVALGKLALEVQSGPEHPLNSRHKLYMLFDGDIGLHSTSMSALDGLQVTSMPDGDKISQRRRVLPIMVVLQKNTSAVLA